MDIEILTFQILHFQKIFRYNKISNKMLTAKNQAGSTHCFGENYLTNHLAKFLQDRVKDTLKAFDDFRNKQQKFMK